VLWRGLISLSRDIPSSDVDLIAGRNRVLVRKDLHPALQYLLLEAMREVHRAPGPFNRLGEFPSELPNEDKSRLGEYRARIAEIESAVRLLKVARPFEADLQRLRIHLRMVQDGIGRTEAVAG